MKKILLGIAVIIACTSVKAQVIYDYLKAADEYFKKENYFSAAQYYEKYLGINKSKTLQDVYNPYTIQTGGKKGKQLLSSKQQAIYNLAESYRKLHYHVKAEPYYKEAVKFDKAQFPLAKYWYATTLRALEKYSEAETGFNDFLTDYTTEDKYREAATREIANLKFIQVQLNKKDLGLYTVNKTGTEISDTGAVYAPLWFGNTLYFTSTKPDNSAPKMQVYNNRVYQASYSEGAISNVAKTALPESKDMQQGVISFTPDGNNMFLTRWTIANGKKTSAIYSSKKSASGWSDPVALDAPVNAAGYNSQQAFVMPDGKYLLFASDQPGGLGGFDLWSAQLDASGNLSNPVNMGNAINTNFDEQAPFYHAASGNLVFSSNGRTGMGGFDFFQSKGTPGNWQPPVNFGYPVNSVKDDIYFASRGPARNILEEVLFSSDRNAVCCLELFSLKKVKPLKQLSGKVIACDNKTPLAGVTVNIIDTINGKTVATKTTASDGTYSFTLEEFQPLKAEAAINGYFNNALLFNSADEEAEKYVIPELCMNVIPQEQPVVLQNVYYDYDKSDLKPESYPELDRLVAMMNEHPSREIEISAHTDNKGADAYNQKLSEARAKSVVNYLISKGIDAARLTSKGYAATQPIAPNQNDDGSDNPEGRQLNRRTEFKIIKN